MSEVEPLDRALRRGFPVSAEEARVTRTAGRYEPLRTRVVNKVLIINRKWAPERLTLVLCDEPLGF
ncbi:hypothetical protein ACVWZ8_003686 [Arthrobacter sp. UYCu723]